jgi:hypothetical protein
MVRSLIAEHVERAVSAIPRIEGPRGEKGEPGRDGRDGLPGGPAGPKGDTGEPGRGMEYRGVWKTGEEYEVGHCTTYGGSTWHCNEPTKSKPGDGPAWTLMVKRGRDGRDYKAPPASEDR